MDNVALRLVQLQRECFDPKPWYGFIAGESDRLVVVQLVSDTSDLDGYRCVRREDLTFIEDTFPRSDFIGRALRLKRSKPEPSPIRVAETMREMMAAIKQTYGLVTIHR